MTNRTFTPFVGFGDIKFGATRAEVLTLLNAEYVQIRHGSDSKVFEDHYDSLGFKVEYGPDLTVIRVETFNYMGFPCRFSGKNLTPMSFAKLERYFKKIAPDTEPYDIGLYVPSLGLTVCYTAFDTDPEETTDAFCMVIKNYVELMKLYI